MKILVDLTYINTKTLKSGSLSIYAYRLLSAISKLGRADEFIILVSPDTEYYIKEMLSGFRIIVFPENNRYKESYFRGLKNAKAINKIISTEKVDLFFSPYLFPMSLYTTKVPSIAVLHDSGGFTMSKYWFRNYRYKLLITRLIKKISRLILISNGAKDEILSELPNHDLKYSILNNVIDYKEYPLEQLEKIDQTPYILSVNRVVRHKNYTTLVKAFALIKDEIPHNLIIKSIKTSEWENVVLPLILNLNIKERTILIDEDYSDSQMHSLYCGASLFVTTSLLEGFGYTPIEAAIRKIPVICHNLPVIFETTRGLLNYYDPGTDEFALKDKILEILNNEGRENLDSISNRLISEYSSSNQATIFINLVEEELTK